MQLTDFFLEKLADPTPDRKNLENGRNFMNRNLKVKEQPLLSQSR